MFFSIFVKAPIADGQFHIWWIARRLIVTWRKYSNFFFKYIIENDLNAIFIPVTEILVTNKVIGVSRIDCNMCNFNLVICCDDFEYAPCIESFRIWCDSARCR
ncbi:hypothetical protein A264_21804 [Pseudomonas syringae pv. actinidiae ICMP 19071]|uniref:Uncharacterized protein n=2 Tax=Pseudomonas syringae group TaxID=136849 RepID=A0A261WHS3_9PSED|nr:hypothetical protein JN853_17055 [Pseudomonas syringae pv. actinidiae ICMP 9853]ATV18193.1 hypothetical protein CT122_16125 [Pseudomonas syringae pv. actinidiae]EGH68512.1 hypothetical protein PSYAC_27156 [Pseudomonas syringae pv. actinidiae str. M302091]EPM44355.1 hypothetical protein A256_26873 [Pseudomonas syringae pv. actinidiae ICMP 19103]EPM55788.1 hypothetical protein A264_21804 [Pseudomonas syringae pv. actinidiae ICMP 19071]EPM75457.1 hypothetical protein A3SO_21405 [Pseudomonas sy